MNHVRSAAAARSARLYRSVFHGRTRGPLALWRGIAAVMLAALSGVLQAPRMARAVVIDDFEVGPFFVQRPAANSVNVTGLDPSHVVGGRRNPIMEGISTNGAFASLAPSDVADDGMTLTTPSGNRAGLTTVYLSDGTESAWVPLDATASGADDAFRITVGDVLGAPAAGWQIGIFAANRPIPGRRASVYRDVYGPGQYDFPFATFTSLSGESVPDFVHLDVLFLYVKSQPFVPAGSTSSITIIDFRTVPEPHSAALFIVAAAYGRSCRSRRRQIRRSTATSEYEGAL